VFGVLVPLIADDLTRGLNRFNLCIGIFGLAAFAGAALSTTLAGWIADAAGEPAAFLGLALAGAAGTALVWLAMPDTRHRADARRLNEGRPGGAASLAWRCFRRCSRVSAAPE
jgi:MFS family permease